MDNSYIYLSDLDNFGVCVLNKDDEDWSVHYTLGRGKRGNRKGYMNRPRGMCILTSPTHTHPPRLYLTDAGGSEGRVQIFE